MAVPMILLSVTLVAFLQFVKASSGDRVTELPGWNTAFTWTMYAGYLPVWPECDGNLFYWFVEKDGGSKPDTPVLIWLNGGPGASSLTGFFVENIGPFNINGSEMVANKYSWTNKYNLLIIDNPVGTGFSNTTNKPDCYASTLWQVAEQFYKGLVVFFQERHPEYSNAPLWLTGESYAGTYIPYIAWELHQRNFPFAGMIMGNGDYYPERDILTVPVRFYQEGLLDEHGNEVVTRLAEQCANKMNPVLNATDMFATCTKVMDVACDLAGGVFQYDLRVFTDVFADISVELSNYLNREDVKTAIHTSGNVWTDADATGPVADALAAEYAANVTTLLAMLLDLNYKIIAYNGVTDGSSCNHLGNAKVLLDLDWGGKAMYAAAKQSAWRISDTNFLGFTRIYKNLAYVTIQNSGHLVPMNQPENFRRLLDKAVSEELFQMN